MSSHRKFQPHNDSYNASKTTTPNSPFSRSLPKATDTTRSADSSILSKASLTSSNRRYKSIVDTIGLSLNFDCHIVCPPELGLFATRFETLDVIARGSFGCVKKCIDLLNDKYRACKKIYCIPSEPLTTSTEDVSHMEEKSSSSATIITSNPFISSLRRDHRNNKGKLSIDNIYNEIFILHQIDHPNIIRLFSYYDEYRNNIFYLIFEYSCMGPIIDIPTNEGLSEGLIRSYLRDIISAIEYIHSRNIVHCDIKPSNILVFEKHLVKLCDFGSSIISNHIHSYCITNSNRPKTSLAFQSPEYLACESGQSINLVGCDIWSVGITAYSMITGNIPWSSYTIGTLINDIEKSPVKFHDDNYVNPGLEEIVLRMLAKKPEERITIDAVKRNSWLTLAGRWPII